MFDTRRRRQQLEEARHRDIVNIVCTKHDPPVTNLLTLDSESHPSSSLLNATSLNKAHAMQQHITDIHRGNNNIVFITETWPSSKQHSTNFDIPGYNMQRHDRCRRVGGGLCTYIRNCINICDFSPTCTSDNVEIVWSHCMATFTIIWLIAIILQNRNTRGVCYLVIHVIDFITASVDQPYFFIAGDFNSLDTSFLETW